MDAEENQRQVFLRAHSPWKSQTTRFPHSHSRCSAWKSGKPKAGFPLSHLLSLLFNQIKKGNPAADRFAPASRLILQLENAVLCRGLTVQSPGIVKLGEPLAALFAGQQVLFQLA
jgi:hypothetical protein